MTDCAPLAFGAGAGLQRCCNTKRVSLCAAYLQHGREGDVHQADVLAQEEGALQGRNRVGMKLVKKQSQYKIQYNN